ncbi:MAG: hypothetical protein E7052_05245 [Lentisphaerae bacterium]|nr:hypothetical protein [Lentisphaerota bacterium]
MRIFRLQEPESGVALISVLVLLSSVSLMVLSMVAYSQLAGYGIRNDANVLRSRYVAEGAMNRVIWTLAADNYVYNTGDLSNFDYDEFEEERFIPDGRLREMDYHGIKVKYRIENGAGGLSIDGNVDNALNYLTRVRSVNEEDLNEALTIFRTRFTDYTDSNDTAGVDGMERTEYEELDADTRLPRDAALQFREELWFIPDGVKFFPPDCNGRLSWINPLGMGGSRRNRPDLLQANYALLTNYANLSHEDAMETLRIIKSFKKTPVILSEEFDPLLLASLRNYFSITNSGCYRVTIENAADDNAASVRMDATFNDPGIESNSDKQITFYDWLIY